MRLGVDGHGWVAVGWTHRYLSDAMLPSSVGMVELNALLETELARAARGARRGRGGARRGARVRRRAERRDGWQWSVDSRAQLEEDTQFAELARDHARQRVPIQRPTAVRSAGGAGRGASRRTGRAVE